MYTQKKGDEEGKVCWGSGEAGRGKILKNVQRQSLCRVIINVTRINAHDLLLGPVK
jgi:hypothetical protein